MDLATTIDRLAERPQLEPLRRVAAGAAGRLDRRPALVSLLRGRGLGHPLHPALTDLPIGFWTSAFTLDLLGSRHERTARLLVGLGVLSSVPTLASGAAELRLRPERQQRVAALHGVVNLTATALYAGSWLARRGGRRDAGVALAMAGASVATVGGALGGWLVASSTS